MTKDMNTATETNLGMKVKVTTDKLSRVSHTWFLKEKVKENSSLLL